MKIKQSFTIGIFVALVFISGWYLWQEKSTSKEELVTPNSTSNPRLADLGPVSDWTVCRSEKYGYEFKYPKGWYVSGSASSSINTQETVCHDEVKSVTLSPLADAANQSRPYVNFGVQTQKELDETTTESRDVTFEGITSIDDYIERLRKITHGHPAAEDMKETTIDGEKAFWIEGKTVHKEVVNIALEVFHEDSLFVMNFSDIEPEVRDAIAASFKFLP